MREIKTKISTQSKKNFVLEKDVRYLDSRIALLIQNRMALEEVGCRCSSSFCFPSLVVDIVYHSNMRLPAIWTTPPTSKKVAFPTMIRRKSMATCSFSCNLSLDTLHTSAA